MRGTTTRAKEHWASRDPRRAEPWARCRECVRAALSALLAVILAPSLSHAEGWDGPTTGPRGVTDKRIIVVAEDMRNDGIGGVVNGINEAAGALGWLVTVLDAAGSPTDLPSVLRAAVSDEAAADGVILVGLDAVRGMPDYGARAEARHLPVVGWHVGPQPGPVASTPVAVNVTTDPRIVARLAADTAIEQSNGHAGVAILTDYRYAIAVVKARGMANRIKTCAQCTLLEIVDLPLSDSGRRMSAEIARLREQYGERMTDILAINDLYFDDAVGDLRREGVAHEALSLISAGDGSPSAIERIRDDEYQTATVAEPLALQAWQLVDELNRLLAHEPISGFVAAPYLVTRAAPVPALADFRAIYRRIWQR